MLFMLLESISACVCSSRPVNSGVMRLIEVLLQLRMPKPSFKRSIFFTDNSKEVHFLFQILNLGKNTDELKFVFTHPESGMGGMYIETRERFTGKEVIRLQPEISYYADGSLLQKMPS